jgi:hypothetical protein
MRFRSITIVLLLLFATGFTMREAQAQQKLLIYMDLEQTDHLKAYGITYWALAKGMEMDWLLNYRGGSFMADYSDQLASECRIRGVAFESLDPSAAQSIYQLVQS